MTHLQNQDDGEKRKHKMVNDLTNCYSGSASFMSLSRGIAEKMALEEEAWIASLRAAGVKAAQGDDGRVDRKHNIVWLVNPDFNDGVGVGDLIALGWPQWGSNKLRHRIVRLTERGECSLGGFRWKFEPVCNPKSKLLPDPELNRIFLECIWLSTLLTVVTFTIVVLFSKGN